ncbi:MAG: Grx4 family monothiol glutaredoxin [Planctomycetota bacterium]|jgi:monothiol glutaredoxin
MWSKEDIDKVVKENQLVVFAKGTKEQPMCGFSHRAIHVLSLVEKPFEVVNIFDDPSIRPALVDYSGWPTTPQVFINGELIGGSDIVMEMYESGELQKKVSEGA